jgi:hypothetical protein
MKMMMTIKSMKTVELDLRGQQTKQIYHQWRRRTLRMGMHRVFRAVRYRVVQIVAQRRRVVRVKL